MKYVDVKVTFAEVPDEISLCFNISNCPFHCKGCHSPYLWEDVGTELTPEILESKIESNPGISCICLCGGDAEPQTVEDLFRYLRCTHPELKTAWYSGNSVFSENILRFLDFIKIGPYVESLGPLDSVTTNQVFYKVEGSKLVNITDRFQKTEEI